MLDKLTRVGPPQTDSLIKNQRTEKLEDLGAQNLKSDFKENLKQQIKKDQIKFDQKAADRQKLEKQESQPGENKKKVAKKNDSEPDNEKEFEQKKNDPTMISIAMVSSESEVEIPDETLNLAMIEESKIDLTNNLSITDLMDQVQGEPAEIQQAVSVDVVDHAVPESLLDPGAQEVVDLSASSASSDFQNKIMDALKKDQFSKSELNLDQITEKMSVEQPEIHLSENSTTDSESSNQDSSSKDSKSLKEDFIKSELMKSESHHTGQNEFRTQLSTMDQASAKGTENVFKSETDSDPNVKDLLNQAHYLVTQGGGEVTLKMNSLEGMGEVHLKVMMDHGKMNIELNTEDKSVKKLIEDSLSDLRSSLAAKQISLEHVKINSVNATNTENNSGSMQNSNQQSGSESNQSKMFDQFQQQMQQQKNQNQQRHFSNVLLNDERPVVLPIKSLQKSAANQYYGLNKATALNAVA